MAKKEPFPQNFSKAVAPTFAFITGVIFILISVLSVVELSSRISAKRLVLEKIDSVEKIATSFEKNNSDEEKDIFLSYLYRDEVEILRLIVDDLDHLNITGAEAARQTVHAIRPRLFERSVAEKIKQDNEAMRRQIASLNTEISSLRALEADQISNIRRIDGVAFLGTGEGGGFTVEGELSSDGRAELSLLINTQENIEQLREQVALLTNEIAKNQLSITWIPSIFVKYNPISYMSSDLIIALSIVFCGGIGAIFSASRSDKPAYSKSIFNGLMAGFVAFLVIKGGRFLFLIETGSASSVFLNPYASAFAGILAGLFTEKAYRLLSEFVDQFGKRVVAAERVGEKN